MNRYGLINLMVASGTLLLVNGCAQFIAYQHPPPLNHEMLEIGKERAQIQGVVGVPVSTEDNPDGSVTCGYKYADGGKKNAWWSKTGRIILYTAGDVFTAFLDQIIWMPLEIAFKPTEYSADITYAKSDHHWDAVEIREFDASDGKLVMDVADESWKGRRDAAAAAAAAEEAGKKANQPPPPQ